MGEIVHVDLYFERALAGCIDLPDALNGVYWCACFAIYRQGGPVTVADIVRWRPNRGAALRSLNKLIELGKLIRTADGRLDNPMCERMLEAARRRLSRRRVTQDPTHSATQDPTHAIASNAAENLASASHTPPTTTNHQTPEDPPSGDLPETRARDAAPGFDTWWDEYPHKVAERSARLAYAQAVARGASQAELLDGLRRYVDTKPPDRQWLNPASFLSGERWRDQPATVFRGSNVRPARLSARSALFRGFAEAAGISCGADFSPTTALLDRRRTA